MSVEAYIFVECEHGKATAVAESLQSIAGVEDSRAVTGPYDVIARVCASSFKVLGDVVVKKIQGVNGVKRTMTNVIID